MYIKLTPKSAFWSLVDPLTRKLIVHLTFQKPGPVFVNEDSLNPHCKQILDAGLSFGNIMQVTDPDKKKAKKAESKPKEGTEDARVSKQEMSAEELLKEGVRGIRDQLRDKTHTAEFLSRAIELEKEGAARKTVLTALEQKLNKVGGTTAVVDTDEEQIEINLA